MLKSDCPVDILQNSKELYEMIALYKEVKPKLILEIGSLYGGTIFFWLKEADWPITVVSIDLSIPEETSNTWKSWQKEGQHLFTIEGNSSHENIIRLVEGIFFNGIDWLLIDGGHHYDEVKSDYENYFPLVKKGGHCLFHDIIGEPGVIRLWNEIKSTGIEVKEISHEPPYLGIGIIKKA